MKLFVVLFSFVLGFQAMAFSCNGDLVLTSIPRSDRQDCMAPGQCLMMDFNPETQKWEYFNGFHVSCPGQQIRTIEEWICQRPDESIYTDRQDGPWGFCQI